jgi:hypothetical protein
MLRRRRNEPELTWDEFFALKSPFLQQVNEKRVDFAQIFYKAAVGHFAGKKYLRTAGNATLAILLRPRPVLSEIISKSRWRVTGNKKQPTSHLQSRG